MSNNTSLEVALLLGETSYTLTGHFWADLLGCLAGEKKMQLGLPGKPPK